VKAAKPVRITESGLAAAIVAAALIAGCTKESSSTTASTSTQAAGAATAATAAAPLPSEVSALIERAAIENLYAEYYAHFGTGFVDYAQYFTQDGVLDVNGLVADGADAIKALYIRADGGTGEKPKEKTPASPPPGKFQMLLTNLKVDVNGDSAKVEALWSSLLSKTLVDPPAVTEYGGEQAELVKQGGHWLIRKRVVTSYGGMPKGELKSYVPR